MQRHQVADCASGRFRKVSSVTQHLIGGCCSAQGNYRIPRIPNLLSHKAVPFVERGKKQKALGVFDSLADSTIAGTQMEERRWQGEDDCRGLEGGEFSRLPSNLRRFEFEHNTNRYDSTAGTYIWHLLHRVPKGRVSSSHE